MDEPETEPQRSRQVPTLLWLLLALLLVLAFSALAYLLGRPSSDLSTAGPPANPAAQSVLAAPEAPASKLD
jgi:type VI protein secretion system component VasF